MFICIHIEVRIATIKYVIKYTLLYQKRYCNSFQKNQLIF